MLLFLLQTLVYNLQSDIVYHDLRFVGLCKESHEMCVSSDFVIGLREMHISDKACNCNDGASGKLTHFLW